MEGDAEQWWRDYLNPPPLTNRGQPTCHCQGGAGWPVARDQGHMYGSQAKPRVHPSCWSIYLPYWRRASHKRRPIHSEAVRRLAIQLRRLLATRLVSMEGHLAGP